MKLPTHLYYPKENSATLDIVLPGGSVGVETPFMQKVINTLKKGKNSILAFNFPYYERGEDQSSGEELEEELQALKVMMDFAQADKYKKIRFVGKSLGAIVASFYLNKLTAEQMKRYSLVVLGCVTGSLKLNNFTGPITIIQGEKDKFGGIEKVKEDLKNAKSENIKYFEIKKAGHSFNDPETKEPLYEDDVMKILSSLM